MERSLWLLAVLGALGAFDTLYFHEWRGMLPARMPQMRSELALHAARDAIYVAVFATLPLVAWHGVLAAVFAALLVAEIGITLTDFVVEDRVRKPLGGLFAGERITHALMAIVYGAMLANLAPVLLGWLRRPTGFAASAAASAPIALRWTILALAGGIAVSGARDLYAVLRQPEGGWPWTAVVSR